MASEYYITEDGGQFCCEMCPDEEDPIDSNANSIDSTAANQDMNVKSIDSSGVDVGSNVKSIDSTSANIDMNVKSVDSSGVGINVDKNGGEVNIDDAIAAAAIKDSVPISKESSSQDSVSKPLDVSSRVAEPVPGDSVDGHVSQASSQDSIYKDSFEDSVSRFSSEEPASKVSVEDSVPKVSDSNLKVDSDSKLTSNVSTSKTAIDDTPAETAGVESVDELTIEDSVSKVTASNDESASNKLDNTYEDITELKDASSDAQASVLSAKGDGEKPSIAPKPRSVFLTKTISQDDEDNISESKEGKSITQTYEVNKSTDEKSSNENLSKSIENTDCQVSMIQETEQKDESDKVSLKEMNKCEDLDTISNRDSSQIDDAELKKKYPDEYNPFGDEEEESDECTELAEIESDSLKNKDVDLKMKLATLPAFRKNEGKEVVSSKSYTMDKKVVLADLNPFGSDSEEEDDQEITQDDSKLDESTKLDESISAKLNESSTNPFWSGDEEPDSEPISLLNTSIVSSGGKPKPPRPPPPSAAVTPSRVSASPLPPPRGVNSASKIAMTPNSARRLAPGPPSHRFVPIVVAFQL